MASEGTGRQWIPLPTSADGIIADFYSEMKTIPTHAMLDALLEAKVGDVQKGEDPTTNECCGLV